MSRPFISVLTTLYNHERFIHQTVASALNQTSPPDEIVIIDDASTDNSWAIAAAIPHPSIRLMRQPSNLGGATTMKGLHACRGDFIAILNSDDYWQSDKLQRQIEYMLATPQCGVIFTRVSLVDDNDICWKPGSHNLHSTFSAPNRHREAWLNHFFSKGNPFCASSALIRGECLQRLGPLDGRYIQLQDLEMWLRIAINGYEIRVLEEKLTNYRVSRKYSNMSASTDISRAIFIYEYSRLLRDFWLQRDLSGLVRIFPELEISDEADDSLTLFYLAKLASSQNTLHHSQFAVDTMFEWGANESAMNMAYKCHGFTHAEYRRFISENPLAAMENRQWSRKIKTLAKAILPQRAHQLFRQALLKDTQNIF